jgi:hypothetical protein
MTSQAKTDRVPFTMEECYDIFRQMFHSESDARAAVLFLFAGDADGWEDKM